MTLQKLRQVAADHGVRASRLNKISLVRAIQRQEGNFDCFATAYAGDCDQAACLWRGDCLTLSQKAAA